MTHSASWRWQLPMIALAVVSSLPCWASEMAVLRNGFSIRHERREVIGGITRLYVKADGSSYVDVPTAEIEHFEEDENTATGNQASGSGLRASAETQMFDLVAGCRASTLDGSPKPDCRSSKPDLNELVNAASGRYRLDPDLVSSVIKAESGFNVRAVSPKGAQGLMQLMPDTALKLGVPDAFDPQANVEGGTRYLRELLERYNFDLVKALAAYNAGPLRVEQYGGVPPYHETRAYVARVVKDFNKKKKVEQKSTGGQDRLKQESATTATKARTRVATSKPQSSRPQVQAKASD
ncbi:MAG TPA: lytic transglycosylase domain-containing protein [Candidatus Sulfotelmatobacter sp.]|nr:lytic transglycosylase domain-containing protein [Candidatus Sulfotelmatobacter sp.]